MSGGEVSRCSLAKTRLCSKPDQTATVCSWPCAGNGACMFCVSFRKNLTFKAILGNNILFRLFLAGRWINKSGPGVQTSSMSLFKFN